MFVVPCVVCSVVMSASGLVPDDDDVSHDEEVLPSPFYKQPVFFWTFGLMPIFFAQIVCKSITYASPKSVHLIFDFGLMPIFLDFWTFGLKRTDFGLKETFVTTMKIKAL